LKLKIKLQQGNTNLKINTNKLIVEEYWRRQFNIVVREMMQLWQKNKEWEDLIVKKLVGLETMDIDNSSVGNFSIKMLKI